VNIVSLAQGPTSEYIPNTGRVPGASRYGFRVGNLEISYRDRWLSGELLRECADIAHEQSEGTVAIIESLKGAIRAVHSLLSMLGPYYDSRGKLAVEDTHFKLFSLWTLCATVGDVVSRPEFETEGGHTPERLSQLPIIAAEACRIMVDLERMASDAGLKDSHETTETHKAAVRNLAADIERVYGQRINNTTLKMMCLNMVLQMRQLDI
jgi:hypothetical protein